MIHMEYIDSSFIVLQLIYIDITIQIQTLIFIVAHILYRLTQRFGGQPFGFIQNIKKETENCRFLISLRKKVFTEPYETF